MFSPSRLRPSILGPSFTCLLRRHVSTLVNNPHIYVFPSATQNSHVLSLLATDPPALSLSIGHTTAIPPTPASFKENPRFLAIVNDVLAAKAALDPALMAQAAAFAQRSAGVVGRRGGAARQPARGGWVHISDERAAPDDGRRIAWPEDIFGSLEVDGQGHFVDGGRYQPSGTYRIVTPQGILGLSPFLRAHLVAHLAHLAEQPASPEALA
ncbi:unnamed protein product [Blumeria hordei]|uniref:Uncharacterized protein n=1 Tax=Blumeria hordei TaxID=2867405 RepID=A0A383UTR6_BLUHO|nr:unnamed protein product [Blumeria hordei]